MTDVLFVVLIVAFFAGSALLARSIDSRGLDRR